MEYFLTYIIAFLLIYLIYFLFVVSRKRATEKLKNSIEVRYLINRYNIELDKIDMKKLSNRIAISNSFIMATVFIIILFVKNFILKMLLGFVSLIPLILLVYHILAKSLKKKEGE